MFEIKAKGWWDAAVALVQEPEFQRNANLVAESPNLKWMYVGFGVVFLATLLVRSRALATTDRWYVRLLLRLVIAPVFLGGLLVVAYLALGTPILDLLLAVLSVYK